MLCLDEKSQIQAPILPLRADLQKKATHDTRRNGTRTLFAALDVVEGAARTNTLFEVVRRFHHVF